DAAFFGYNPVEAEIIDPQHRLFLECAWQALETAGYDPGRYPGRIGVFGGSAMIRYAQNVYGNPEVTADGVALMISATPDYLCTRVAYQLNLRGPAVVVQSACSTSLLATHLARKSLLDGESDIALAGGVALTGYLKPRGYRYMAGGMVSNDGHCRAFDAKAGGTVFADGVGLVVLKRLNDAIADGDHIHAVMLGSASNNDGMLKVGYTAPGFDGQMDAIRAAHRDAGTDPETITYIETHGTGTILGDPIEVGALTKAFATDKRNYCALGTLKPNIGHTDATASVAGLIKASMVLERGIIPPCLNFEESNPEIDFESSPFFVNTELREWKTEGIPRRAGVSGFGVGGTNVHMVLEEAPPLPPPSPSRPWQLLRLSARTPTALETMTANLADYFEAHPELSLADAAFTLKVGRAMFKQRKVWVCRDLGEAVAALRDEDSGWSEGIEEERRRVGFLFPGQGSQYAGMGQGLYETEATFRDEVDRAAEILAPHLGLDLRQLLFPPADQREEAGRQLEETWLTQPALFVIEYALARLWMSWGILPDGMLGHSIGEYVAACLAGVFSVEDALALVAARGRMMQEMPPGAMLSVPLQAQEVRDLLGEEISLAAVNSPKLCTVSGPFEAIDKLAATLEARDVKCRRLHTSHAFHSPMMEPAVERFTERVAAVALHPPEKPFLSNVTGTWITAEQATDPAYWGRHLRQAVLFAAGVGELLAEPDRVLLEVGPGRSLSALVLQAGAQPKPVVLPSLRPPNRDDEDPPFLLTTLGRLWLAGVEADWKSFYRDQQRRRVKLPTYPFERRRYWVPAVSLGFGLMGRAVRHPDPADWVCAPVWEESPLPQLFDAGAEDDGSWLLLDDEGGLGEALAEQLRAAGRRVSMVRVGEGFARLDDDVYTVAPATDADYEALLTPEIRKDLQHILHLWNVTPGDGSPPHVEEAASVLETGFYGLLALVRALGRGELGESLHLAVVSNGLHRLIGDRALWPEKAAVLGPCKVIPEEYPGIRCSSIDITLTHSTPEIEARRLLDELAAEPGDDQVIAYRDGVRFVEGFKAVRLEKTVDQRLPLRERGVYWITGGLGGLGLALARHLAAEYKARLVLTGRSPVPAASAKVRALEDLGAEVLAAQADVTDQAAMSRVAAAARERFGSIAGVFHAAGVPGGGVIQLKEREVAAQVLAPKVEGTRVLEAVLGDQQPEFLVLFSSITGVLPTFGQVDYCAANNVLDAYAEDYALRRPASRALSVAWGPWDEVGMAAKAELPGAPAARKAEPTGESVGHPLLHRRLPAKGSETVFVSELDPERDWVLAEHSVVGIPTVPGTTYLEMAHAAFENLTGSVEAELSEIVFLYPMMVDEGSRREVHTTLEKSGEGYAFRVASRDGDTSWQEHVRGRIGPLPSVESAPCDLEAIRARCQLRELGSAALREEKGPEADEPEEVPVTLGPRWNSRGELHLGEDEALVEITLPEEFAGDVELMRLHPALLDVATGMGRGLSQWGSTLPLSYGQLRMRRPLGRRFFAHLRSDPETRGRRETFTVNLTLVDESGAVLVEIDQFTLKQAGRAVGRLTRGAAGGPEAAAAGPYGESQGAIGEGIAPQEGVELLRRMLSCYEGRRLVVSPRDLRGMLEQQAINRRRERRGPTLAESREKHERPDLKTSYVAPRNQLERQIAAIWEDLMGIAEVGIHDDFLELGGHSLLSMQIHSRLQDALGVNLPLPAVFEAQTIADMASRVSEFVTPEAEEVGRARPPVVRVSREDRLPLAYSQLRQWFLDQWDPGTPAYNLPAALPFLGILEPAVLAATFRELVRRHEVLRTRFVLREGEIEPDQVVETEPVVPFYLIDLRHLSGAHLEAERKRLSEAELVWSFDLSRLPLFRATLMRLEEERWLMMLTFHHIITDGWSSGIFSRELAAVYEAFLVDEPSPLPELPVQFVDYAVWQRQWLQGEVLERELAYWRERLGDGGSPPIDLPTDRPRPPLQSFRGHRLSFRLPIELSERLEALGRGEGATFFMVLLAAFDTLLHRHTSQTDISVGTFIAGRSRPEFERLIGFFINTLVMRLALRADTTYRELLARVREMTLGAYSHQDVPFEQILEQLKPERDLSHTPFFQVMLVLQNLPEIDFSMTGAVPEARGAGGQEQANFDLSLWLVEIEGQYQADLDYNTDLFDTSTVQRWVRQLQTLLRGIADDPDRNLVELPLVDAAERHHVLAEWSATPATVSYAPSFQELFETRAAQSPGAVALVDPTTGEELNYGELNHRANRLAHYLRQRGVAGDAGPRQAVSSEVRVGLMLERSCDQVVGILGILKAGGAYLPLDPAFPKERLKLILEDARMAVLLTHRGLDVNLPELGNGDPAVVALDREAERIAACSPENPVPPAPAESAAYVIYTSGSTGKPKGVLVSQRSLAWYSAAAIEHYDLVPEDRVLQFSSISFDISVEEIFPCLARGATLVLRNDEMLSPAEFCRRCREWSITLVSPPTAFWHELAAAVTAEPDSFPPSLRLLIAGGDRLLPEPAADMQRLVGRRVRMVNTYGPTETTVVATLCELTGDGEVEIPIGRPVPNAEVYVVDQGFRSVACGVAGELCIGGDGVARGYLEHPAATADRFIPHPWAAVSGRRRAGERLYRTGDLARLRADGNLEFLGRIDHQVKIRGFRVEPGEIEAHLDQHPGVQEAAVTACDDQSGVLRLVGYVVPREGVPAPGAGELRDFLAATLPEYMVPAAFVVLEALPRTPTGKLDRRALPEPEEDRAVPEDYVPPETETEELLAEMFAEILGRERVGIYDDFFALGGHSLLATRLITRIRNTFEVELPLRDFFTGATVASMAAIIEDQLIAQLEELSEEEIEAMSQ
ncbi:MAG: amino acid adenylation domain-containing protein, partial [bacterium]|nr:amino acid adenylation domain-containing protein [bacterium]